ncbi:MAG: hypothetical protein ACOCXG_00375 [Nanoarchaeota archaeon]
MENTLDGMDLTQYFFVGNNKEEIQQFLEGLRGLSPNIGIMAVIGPQIYARKGLEPINPETINTITNLTKTCTHTLNRSTLYLKKGLVRRYQNPTKDYERIGLTYQKILERCKQLGKCDGEFIDLDCFETGHTIEINGEFMKNWFGIEPIYEPKVHQIRRQPTQIPKIGRKPPIPPRRLERRLQFPLVDDSNIRRGAVKAGLHYIA